MKLFAVVVLALVALNYASPRYQTSEENLSRRNGHRMFNQNSESSSEEISNSRSNQNWGSLNHELEEILDESLPYSSSADQFESPASKFPQAQSFKSKVNRRLNNSDHISRMPELKQELIKIAEQKLESCKTLSGQELDKHCVGRITGQMMQLIAAVENVNHHAVMHNPRSSDY